MPTVGLNDGEIKWNPKKVSNIKSFINRYNWDGIKYPSKVNDWKTFEKNNPIVAFLYERKGNMSDLYFKD